MLPNGGLLKRNKKKRSRQSAGSDAHGSPSNSHRNSNGNGQFKPSRSSLLNIDDDNDPSPHNNHHQHHRSKKLKKSHAPSSSLRANIESALGKSLPDGREEAEEIDEIEVLKQRKRAREREERKEDKQKRRREDEERRKTDEYVREKEEKKRKKKKRATEEVVLSSYNPDSDIVRQEWNGINGADAAEYEELVDASGDGDDREEEHEVPVRPGPLSIKKNRTPTAQVEIPIENETDDLNGGSELANGFEPPGVQDADGEQEEYYPESEPPVAPENFVDLTRASYDSEPPPREQATSPENPDFTRLLDEMAEDSLPSSLAQQSNPTSGSSEKPMTSSSSTVRSPSAPRQQPKRARVRKSMAADLLKGQGNDAEGSFSPFSSTTGLFMDPTPKSMRQKKSTTATSTSSQQQPQSSDRETRKKLAEEAEKLLEHRQSLPIWDYADEIRKNLLESDTLVLIGETGSGKSTQVGQFLLDEPWFGRKEKVLPKGLVNDNRNLKRKVGGCVAITQPRRVAAINLAKRVAQEVGTEVGDLVGYSIRFDSNCSTGTKIKYVTDGMLLKEILRDPLLLRYDAVVVDEAHERSLSTDLGMGFLKQMVETRAKAGIPLKLVVMSATLDESRMADYIGASPSPENGLPAPAPVCRIPGKLHKVKVLSTPEDISDYNTAVVDTITQINESEPVPGDVLVFLPGQDDIEAVAEALQEFVLPQQGEAGYPKIVVKRLYAALGQAEQNSVFARTPDGQRKVILATNIAETSVTVTGVRHVIDSGLCKVKKFRTELGIDSLLTVFISKASAVQRKGRAGREGPGKCYRLYTDKKFYGLQATTSPEILNCDIALALLTLKARDVDDVFSFPFLDAPPRDALERGLLQLLLLGALGEDGKITDMGRKMAEFPLPPTDARILLGAAEPGADVVLEVIDILACLSVESIFRPLPQNPRGGNKLKKRKPSDDDSDEDEDGDGGGDLAARVVSLRRAFIRPEGDHLTYLTLLRKYSSLGNEQKKIFCRERFLNISALNKALDTRRQLRGLCKRQKLLQDKENPYESNTREVSYPPVDAATADKILRVFVAAMWNKTAQRGQDGKFKTVERRFEVSIHPTSTLKDSIEQERQRMNDRRKGGGKGPGVAGSGGKLEDEKAGQAILFQEVVWTTKPFARCVSRVNPKWIEEFGCIEGFHGG